MSALAMDQQEIDIPREREVIRETDYALVTQARVYWDGLRDMRERRARSRDYYRNKPQEVFKDPDTGQFVKEDELVKAQGRIPYKMNLIRPIVKNLIGQFRSSKTQRMAFPRNREDTESAEMMTEALRHACEVNRSEDTDAEQLEESFLGGLYGWKTSFKWNSELKRPEVEIDPIHPARIFFNRDLTDRRMREIRFIGEIKDVPLEDLVAEFAQSPRDADYLRSLYQANADGFFEQSQEVGFDRMDTMQFDIASDMNLCRVIEIWKKEYKWRTYIHDRVTGTYDETDMAEPDIRELDMRRQIESTILGMPPPPPIELERRYEAKWTVSYLTPYGTILKKVDSPYWHESHPYTIGIASFVDGEIWGLVEDIIDPQRLINRITTAIDYMFGASSKGVLLVPEDSIPVGMTIQQFADEWTRFNGVISFKAKPGMPLPQQVTANAIPAGIFNWMQMMEEMMKDTSGVQGPLTGDNPNAGTAARLYNQQVTQAQTTNKDYFDSFFQTRRQRDLKICKLIAQYYDDPIYLACAGKRADGSKYIQYSPSKVRDLEFDIVMTDTSDTVAARQQIEEQLMQFLQLNRITFRQYLQLSSNPKADLIESVIERTNPLLANTQISDMALGSDPTQAAQRAMATPIQPGQMAMQGGGGEQSTPESGLPPLPPTPEQQLLMQYQQQAQSGDPDAIAILNQLH